MLQDRRKADVTIYGFTNETSTIICAVIANPQAWFIWYSNFEFALNPKNDNVTIISENNASILQVGSCIYSVYVLESLKHSRYENLLFCRHSKSIS